MPKTWKDGDLGEAPDPQTGQPMSVMYLRGKFYRTNEAGHADLGGGFYVSPQGQRFREGPKGGYAKVGGPNDTALARASDAGTKVNSALALLDQFDRALRQVKTGPLGYLSNGSDLSAVEGLGNQLLLNIKEEPYNLGVLQGPDEAILRKVITNPSSLRDAVFRDSVIPRLSNIAGELGRRYRSETSALRGVGGHPGQTVNPLYRSPDSQYTADQWGTEGLIPKNYFKGQDGPYLPRNQRAAPAAKTRKPVFQGRGGTILEVIED